MNALTPYSPSIVLSVGSLLYLIAGPVFEKLKVTAIVATGVMLACFAALLYLAGREEIDAYTTVFSGMAVLSGLLSVIGSERGVEREQISASSEYYFLVLSSLAGALLMIGAQDLLVLFIGLEILSLPLYCLCASRVFTSRSSEAAMKYFLLGCFSSAFIVYGMALWYGATASLELNLAGKGLISVDIATISFLMIVVGLAFKVGFAPFHFWVPDVYQGAPTTVTTFMSCVVKVAAFAAFFRVVELFYPIIGDTGRGVVWLFCVLAMVIGNFAALQQRSVKRLLAYSSVAQAGYIGIGLVVFQGATPEAGFGALGSSLFYLLAYCAMSIGAFVGLSAIGPDADDLRDLRGLWKRSPFVAACLSIIFLGLAGLPPGMAGLVGKIQLFSTAFSAGYIGLVIIAALNTVVGCAYYVKVPFVMMSSEGSAHDASVQPSIQEYVVLGVCASAVVLLGVFPFAFQFLGK